MTHLLLDAAYPPSPQQWIVDMDSVGADGGFVYVWGPITKYTADHVSSARNAGKIVLPIIVPGNVWPGTVSLLAALRAYGFQRGPVVVDLEAGSLPSNTGLILLAQTMLASGYVIDRYGNQSVLGSYSVEGEDWIADWIRRGQLTPLPTLPPGWHTWQFVNDVQINGSQYDASIVSNEFVGDQSSMDPKDPIVQEMRYALARLVTLLSGGNELGATFDSNGVPTYVQEPTWPNWIAASFAAIQPAAIDATAVAAALAANQGFMDNLSTAIAHRLGAALDKA